MSFLELKVPPVVQFLVGAVAMWLIARSTPSLPLPAWISPGGMILFFVLGAAIALAGVLTFGRAKTTVDPTHPDSASALVTSGIYQYTRNPMYVGMLLVLVGWVFYLGNLYAAFVLPLFMLYITRFQIMPEERAMLRLFGESYAQFTERTGRWF